MNVGEAVRRTAERIRPAAAEEAHEQAARMVDFVLGRKTPPFEPFDDALLPRLTALADRRAGGEPLQYLLGEWSFMGLSFLVSPAALIPRQDTELLAELAEARIRERGYKKVLDLCCGSGCVGLALLARDPALELTLSDISPEALALAKENARRLGLAPRFVQGDLWEALLGEHFELIVCNPPYLTEAELKSAQRELSYEPALALDGGADGLRFYRRIAASYREALTNNGLLLMEIGSGQAKSAGALFDDTTVFTDICGLPRVIAAEGDPRCWKN